MGKELCKNNERSRYGRLLPNNTLKTACKTFQSFERNEKDEFMESFNMFNKLQMTESN
jgi:hypothetical protein